MNAIVHLTNLKSTTNNVLKAALKTNDKVRKNRDWEDMKGRAVNWIYMNKIKIGIIGLGYVGLPLAVEFAKKYNTHGFDINVNRINELKKAIDSTQEVSEKELSKVLKNSI